ncbi:MAG TPA: hypothetical protein VGL81_27295 [Polyangiaceae bacterium]|jgi:hypothetical protein
MRALHAAALAALLVTASCGACQPDKSPPPAASSSAPATPPPIASHVQHNLAPPKLACRVAALDGEAHIETPGTARGVDAGSAPLLLQGLVPIDAWIDVGKGSRVVARDPKTTRESTFRGPARARACVGFTEESWLASGTFDSSVGSGEAPGNEEWVVTPWGVVRYTAAALSIEAKPHEADVTLTTGVAFAWQPSAGSGDAGAAAADAGSALEEGWLRLPAGKTRLGAPHDEPVSATLDRCTALASSAKDLATQVMTPGGSNAATITRQVTTRRLARAACAVAALRVDALPPADAAPLLGPLATANSAWSGLPSVRP